MFHSSFNGQLAAQRSRKLEYRFTVYGLHMIFQLFILDVSTNVVAEITLELP